MRYIPLILPVAAISVVLADPVHAQEDDRSWLTAMLEDNLSGAGRKVTITGFAGALSSRATIQKLTIADDEGVWLTIDNAALDWSRTALLSGQVIVNELTATSIVLERVPAGEPAPTTPEAGTFEFALPELPVSIDIGKVQADQITLGESVLGQALTGTLSAELHLAGGAGTAQVSIERTDDGPEAKLALDGSYSNETKQLQLDLQAQEGAGGLVASALDLPGKPAAALTLKGSGTFDDFAADFSLESDGDQRLAGPITVKTVEDGRSFEARLSGNPAPLFLPEYADFLGDALSLDVAGTSYSSGGLALDELSLKARSLNLDGKLRLAAGGMPELINVTGTLQSPDGSAVLLPISGPVDTRIQNAAFGLQFDAAQGSAWTTQLSMTGLDRPDLALARAGMVGGGTLDNQGGKPGLDGSLIFDAEGFDRLDPGLLAAIGPKLAGTTKFHWRQGDNGFSLPQITLKGPDYGLSGAATINGLGDALSTGLDVKLSAQDLGRFSGLAGRPLAGVAEVTLQGTVTPLTGAFDLALNVVGEGLKSGIAEADRLLAGRSVIEASALRDTSGTTLRSFSARAASLNVTGSGKLTSQGADIAANIVWKNLADIGANYGGSLNLNGTFKGDASTGVAQVSGQSQGLRVGQAEADRLISGRSDLAATVALVGGTPVLRALNLTSPHVTAEVAGEGDNGAMRVSGRLSDLGLLVSEFPGPVTLSGRFTPVGGADFDTDLQVRGPAGIDARVSGRMGVVPDLQIQGSGEAAVANPFTDPITVGGRLGYDIRLSGGWTPQNAAGRVTLSGGELAVPARGISLDRIAATADLAAGRAQLAVTADASRGGRIRVDGPLGLVSPFASDLTIRVDGVRLRDAELYDTTLSADLGLSGPLLGAARLAGRIQIGETELRVPATGFASSADLELIRHVGDDAAVRATRARAGIGAVPPGGRDPAAQSSLPPWALDLLIQAPNRIFVRGRGLDAELGGELRVGGTLNNIVPSGGFDLVRGRIDILGKRLVLDQASLTMEGSMIPNVNFSASNVSDEVTSTVTVSGPANDPEVTFSSDPEKPQEEVLAWLLFGRGLDTISAFQAAQLANAVATLAGRGGEGIVSKLRRGFGFDDLDVSTSPDGNTSVSAGKYISEKVYTEVGVDQSGNTRVNLNLNLRPGVTVKGRVDSDGSSGIGLFLERDY
ncbi:translocation and assembly module protein TamB [Xinfangfangia sp. D13-10-4-6]|uniref:translocation/assembly module TamB domain-containing protein n=1 Tax=Pseudogemmobacter hezensis TaxID=2737662 RepID=UPI001557D489|nr:translocation/assembly module TamB domain-containing protein [Pseudogemmobacter hezensis]NPD15388.1 translocation and assembly module protein TamB [Pseudogemmobacter hezensis]